MGIANMHARAEEFGGTLEVGSYPGRGTWIHLEIPYAVQAPSENPQRALTWGAALVIGIMFLIIWTKMFGVALALALLAAIGLARQAIAYRRKRNQGEASP
jgi:hypothetical protein